MIAQVPSQEVKAWRPLRGDRPSFIRVPSQLV